MLQRRSLVAAPEAERRVTVGELADRPVGVVGSDLRGDRPSSTRARRNDIPSNAPAQSSVTAPSSITATPFVASRASRQYDVDFAGTGAARQHDRRVHPAVSDRTRRGGEVRPRARHIEPGVGQHSALEPHPGDVGFGLHGDHVSRRASCR